jgi:hypothetical protein
MRAVNSVNDEREFQQQVLALARISGWKACHPHDAPGSLVLVRPPCLIFVGLKSATGKLRAEQREWLEALARCESVEVILCRPGNWEEIAERLARRDENQARSPPGTPFAQLRSEEKRERYKEQQRRRREGAA